MLCQKLWQIVVAGLTFSLLVLLDLPQIQLWYRYDASASGMPTKIGTDSSSSCDIYTGTWVRDESYPLYQPFKCPFIEEAFKCQEHGRPDQDYLKWRWQPRSCDLPSFNATDMLTRLKNKRLMFIGDSIGRNQWESLVCMLYQGVANRSNVFEASAQAISKMSSTGGSYIVKFADYQVQIEYHCTRFLVREVPVADPRSEIKAQLELHEMDNEEATWRRGHVLVFNSGHWWNRRKIGKRYSVNGSQVLTAYEEAIRTWSRWVKSNLGQSSRVFFRGFEPIHASTGGARSCSKFSQPQVVQQVQEKLKIVERVMQSMQTPATLLNITLLTDQRRDGHVANWGAKPSVEDCSHSFIEHPREATARTRSNNSSNSSSSIVRGGYGIYFTKEASSGWGISQRVAEEYGVCKPQTFSLDGQVLELREIESSALSMELLAVLHCLLSIKLIAESNLFPCNSICAEGLYIYTDSLKALQLLNQCQGNYEMLRSNMRDLLVAIIKVAKSVTKTCGCPIHLCKVKAHTEFEGNNLADKLATRATASKDNQGTFYIRRLPCSTAVCPVYHWARITLD